MSQGKQLIANFKKRWQLLRVLEALLYGIGAGFFIGLVFNEWWWGILLGVSVTAIALLLIKPWAISLEKASMYIDDRLPAAEYSATLLLAAPTGLTGLAQLQQQKVRKHIATEITNITPKTGLKSALWVTIILFLLGFALSWLIDGSKYLHRGARDGEPLMTFTAIDSVAPAYAPPALSEQQLSIRYPSYTGLGTRSSSGLNVKIVEGARLSWTLGFEGAVGEVVLEGFGEQQAMARQTSSPSQNGQRFYKSVTPTLSGYYNFRFSDTLGASYASEIYAVEVYRDKAPEIALKDIEQFTSFDYKDRKEFTFTTKISDDFGIGAAAIIATVSKGSGESVKFREEKLDFDQSLPSGKKAVVLTKKINLDALKMEVGDELYFYVEASDLKTPRPNIARSETFFAVIKDTVSDGFGVEGTLGADLMPDYFRSQRQLIIDTEKLIKERQQLTEEQFKSRSNELGFDQKSLRLKYGQFMGDEADSGIDVTPQISENTFDAEDPTAGFRHDHDGDNEHNLVDEQHDHEEHAHEEHNDHGDEGALEDERSLLEDYVHNHDDPEESTLFSASLKGKLKQAMAEMWDSELYLRLAAPQESLPYQYRALEMIQEIKNSARIYVHRIGFDPPPIKEDKRLSGDLDEIVTFKKQESLATEDIYKDIRSSIAILEDRIATGSRIRVEDKDAFAKAGTALAAIAILEPSKHLKTLQQLKWLTEDRQQPVAVLKAVQRGLTQTLPKPTSKPTIKSNYQGALEQLFMQELQSSDR